MKKRTLILSAAILSSVTIISAVTATIPLYAFSNNPKKSTNKLSENNNQAIVNKLDSLLNQIINISNYENMNKLSALEALTNNSNNLINAIKEAIQVEIQNHIHQFVFNNLTYTSSEIINNISIKLPQTISSNDDKNNQITNVYLSYHSIQLKNTSGSSSFIIDGFNSLSTNTSKKTTEIPNQNSNNKTQNKNTKVSDNDSGSKNTSSSNTKTDGTKIKNDDGSSNSNKENKTVNKNKKNEDGSGSIQKDSNISNLKNNINQLIATKLDSILNNEINIQTFNQIYAGSEYSASYSLINSNLSYAIKYQIENEILNSNVLFSFNNLSYTASEIASNIIIKLPNAISLSNNENSCINGVLLSYCNISLNAKNGDSSFIITGFGSPSPSWNNAFNQLVANQLNTLLSNNINISNNETMNTISAQDALFNNSSNLKTAIINEITSFLTSLNVKFNIEDSSYSISDITKNITITLPQDILISNDENGLIPNVFLSYSGISLTSKNNQTSFTISGFKTINSYNSNNVLNEAYEIDQQLSNNIINLSTYLSSNSITAADALYQANYLNNQITHAINEDIINTKNINKNANISINYILPNSISLLDNEDGQITNVKLLYDGILLNSTNGNTNFTLNGFLKLNSLTLNNPSCTTSNNINQIIATKLDSILNNNIDLTSYALTNNLTVSYALNNIKYLKHLIKEVIQNEIVKELNNFVIGNLSYTSLEILSGININLLNNSKTNILNNSKSINVSLSYNGLTLTSNNNSIFNIIGFVSSTKVSNSTQNVNEIIATKLDSLLNNTIDVANINIASLGQLNTWTPDDIMIFGDLNEIMNKALNNELKNSISTFSINDSSYSLSDILNKITFLFPNGISISNDEDGLIPNIKLSYEGIELIAKNKASTFTLTGFENASSKNSNDEVSTVYEIQKIDSFLNSNINIASYLNMNTYTAADALSNSTNNQSSLYSAITLYVQKAIKQAGYGIALCSLFTTHDINFEASGTLNIFLPNSISLNENENALINNVQLVLNGMYLNAANGSSTFTITGFLNANETSSQNNINEIIANKLDTYLNSTINVADINVLSWNTMSTFSVSEILNNKSSLYSAIIQVIDNWIPNSPFILNNLSYNQYYISNAISIALPSSISQSDINNGQISNVKLYYNGIQLKTSNAQNTFTITGFKTI